DQVGGANRDGHGALPSPRCGPFTHVDALRLVINKKTGTIQSERFGSAYLQGEIPRKLEVKLDKSVPRNQLDPRILVRKVLDHHVDVFTNLRQLPVTFAFIRREHDSGPEQVSARVPRQSLQPPRSLKICKRISHSASGTHQCGTKQPALSLFRLALHTRSCNPRDP